MCGPSYVGIFKKTTRYNLESSIEDHDNDENDEKSPTEGWLDTPKVFDNISIGGSSTAHIGDSKTIHKHYYSLPQQQWNNIALGNRRKGALHELRVRQPIRMMRELQSLEDNVDHVFYDELTAMHFAAWYGFPECVEILVENAADVNATSFKYGTPLCVAAFRGHLHIVDALLSKYHASMDVDGGWLGSPLHAACLRQSELDGPVESHLLQRLLKHGGNLCGSKRVNLDFWAHHRERPSAPDAMHCYLDGHPIHIASYFGQKIAVDRFLNQGAGIDSGAYLGEASERENHEIQDLTPLMLASMRYSNVSTLITLLKKGASTELQDSIGFTALLYAASHNSQQSTRRLITLINSGSDINAMSHEGFTALTVAARNGHAHCFSILRDAGANIFSIDKGSWTAVKHAYSNGHLPALVKSTVQAMLFVSGRWFAVGLCWALKRLADGCQQLHGAATYFDTARVANTGNDSKASEPSCLNHLIQLTEKCHAFLQHIAIRTKQDSKPLFAVNDVVLSCSVLGFAPCLVPILMLKWETDKTTLPWSIAALYMFNKIRSLLSEIQEFLEEFESATAEEKTPTAPDDPG